MKTSSAKSKGRRLQQDVAKKISELTGFECGKDCDIESRPMGQTGCDVRLSSDVKKVFDYHVECKNQETFSIPAWVEKLRKESDKWLLVVAKNRWKPIIVLDMDLFFEILKKEKSDKET